MSTQQTDKKPHDRTPESDLRKALVHMRGACGKYIIAGDEDKGGQVLKAIETVKALLGLLGNSAKDAAS